MSAVEQRSPEWYAMRCGKLTGSRVDDILTKSRDKKGRGQTALGYQAQLISERLTGVVRDTYMSADMRWGIENEPAAREAYEFIHHPVMQIAFVDHPRIQMAGCSPDGLIREAKGQIQIKCLASHNHIAALLNGGAEDEHKNQVQWEIACCETEWSDFVAFDPRLPPHMQLYVKRVMRDDAHIKMLETEAQTFLDEVAETIIKLQQKYGA